MSMAAWCRQGVVWAAVLLSLSARLAAAQTPPPPTVTQTVIVTGTASPLPVDLASRSTTVLGHEDFGTLGILSFADALRLAPALDVRARGPYDVQTDFSIRGATFGQNLVLLDGLRLNNSQSGHHNGELPIPLAAIERIEIVAGAASAVHGADALGGTINVISRRDGFATASVTGGEHGLLLVQGAFSGAGLPAGWVMSGWAGRSGGYASARGADVGDFAQGGIAVRAAVVRGLSVDVSHQRRAFGANGFYGPSPSREWTDQTRASAAFRGLTGDWLTSVQGQFRRHHDHFRWDINRPGFAENRHRTDASEVVIGAERSLGHGRRLAVGTGGGRDLIVSSNLGSHAYDRAHGYAELQIPLGARALVQGGLRLDAYSAFGRAWSPTAGVTTWIRERLKVRASAGRAFRVPTFTELYYRDPAHEAQASLRPERGWSLDAGLEWSPGAWQVTASPFVRWDEDVIDWVKAAPADLWRTTNVRDVTTRGLELAVSRRWSRALLRGFVSRLDLDAPGLGLLSKYVLEYAPWSVGASIAGPVGGGVRGNVSLDFRDRRDGQRYTLLGLRVSRSAGRTDLFLQATNLLDEQYSEVPGVPMPGRWFSAGFTIR